MYRHASLNKAFRTVWNQSRQCFMAVAEFVRGKGGGIGGGSVVRAVGAAILALGAQAVTAQTNWVIPDPAYTYGTTLNLGNGDLLTVQSNGSVGGATVAVQANNGAVIGSISNTGTITAVANGVNLDGASVSGGIVNRGLINSGGGTGAAAIRVAGGSSIDGGVYNTGTISSSHYGIGVNTGNTINNGLTNSGLIIAPSFAGIGLWGGSLNQGVVNTGSIIGGVGGILLNNYAVLTGGILNTAGGYISGVLNDAQISGATAIVNAVGSTIAGGITNTGVINGTGGVAVSNQGAAFNVVNTINGTTYAVGNIVGAINGNVNVSNSGLWALQTMTLGGFVEGSSVSAQITGNYWQSSNATLRMGVNDHGVAGSGTASGNYSALSVGGVATFDASTNIFVSMNAATAVADGGTLVGVVSAAGGLISNGFSIDDNSGLVNFVYASTGGVLDLIAVTQTGCGATVSGNQTGPCEVAFDTPNLYVNSTGNISGASQGVNVLAVTSAPINGRIFNQGTISGSQTGLQFMAGTNYSGGVSNSGTIIGGDRGIKLSSSSELYGGIKNVGLISGGVVGIDLLASNLSGGIANSGLIQGAVTGIAIRSYSELSGGINNSGRIVGVSGAAIRVDQSSNLYGGITNSGLIEGYTGIGIFSGSHLSGGINNTGKIVGVSGAAIRVEQGSNLYGSITNSGVIQGGSNGVAIDIAGYMEGSIHNQAVVTNGVARRGLIQGAINIAGGPYEPFNLINDGRWSMVKPNAIFSNSDIWSYYTQSENALLRVGAESTNSGGYTSLTVAGSAVFANNAHLDVRLNSGYSISVGGTLAGVVSSRYEYVLANNLRITDNSTLFDFGYVQNGNSLDLVAIVNNTGCSGTINTSAGPCEIGVDATDVVIDGPAGGTVTGINYAIQALDLSNSISNSGLITASGVGINVVTSAVMSGGIFNSGTIAGAVGINVAEGAVLTDGILSTAGGYISSINNAGQIGNSNVGIQLGNSTVSGGLTNTGLISGIDLFDHGALSGGIASSGTVMGLWNGILIEASSVLIGGIANSGLVKGGGLGIGVFTHSTLAGGIANSSTVIGVNNAGVLLGTTAVLIGGITNSGLIQGGDVGIGLSTSSTLIGGINNSGRIIGGNTAAISIDNSILLGGITNVGLIGGGSGFAISNNNSGNVIDVVNTVSGNQVGTIVGAITGYANVSNSGLWALYAYGNEGSVVQSILDGNYSQDRQGTLRIGANGDSAGQYSNLIVTGTASFGNNTKLELRFASNSTLTGANLTNIIYAGTLNQNGFAVTDNSALWDYTANVVGGQIDLNAIQGSACTGNINNAVTGGCLVGFDAPNLVVASTGSITGANTGIKVLLGDINGSITNQGFVTGSVAGIFVSSSANLIGGIYNNAVIDAPVGIQVAQNATVQGGIVNTVGGYISSINNAGQVGGAAASLGIFLNRSLISGGVTNSGVISGNDTGIGIREGSTLLGGIVNSGLINGRLEAGIYIAAHSTLVGGLINSGRIEGATGVVVSNSKLVGGIANTGLIQAADTGLALWSQSTLSGGIDNSGSIIGGNGDGFEIWSSSLLAGGLTNTGLIQGVDNGILLGGRATLDGGLFNLGTLSGVVSHALSIDGATLTGGITNSGLFRAGIGRSSSPAHGVLIKSSMVSGGLMNSGSILSTLSQHGGNAVFLQSGATLNGGFTNSGYLEGVGSGLAISASRLQGGIANSGTVSGEVAINLNQAAVLIGGVHNSGLLTGMSGIRISSDSIINGGITNTGFIVGISDAINNQNSNNMIDVLNTVSGNQAGTIIGGIQGYANVINHGLWWLSSPYTVSNSSISGSYVQGPTGTLRFTANTDNSSFNYSTLTANLASFSGNALLDIRFSSNTLLTGNENLTGAIAAGALSANGFNVTDNSALWDYTATVTGSTVNLVANASGACTGSVSGLVNATCLVAFDAPIIRVASTGTISTSNTGVKVLAGDILGVVENTGSIHGNRAGIFVSTSAYLGGGGIINTVGGTITGAIGIDIASGATVIGSMLPTVIGIENSGYVSSINNAGQIGGTNLVVAGIMIKTGGYVAGGITNSGVILSGTSSGMPGAGIALYGGHIDGGIRNAGTVGSIGVGFGVVLYANATLNGGIVNSGFINGGVGVTNSVLIGGLTNTGLIVPNGIGSVLNFGNEFDILNTLNGTQVGTIVGDIAGNLNITNSGLIALQQWAGNTIAAGTTASANITGHFSQLAGAILQIGVNGNNGSGTITGNYSSLFAGSSASLDNGSTISVIMSADHSVLAGGVLAGVVTTSGSLAVGNIKVSDNSTLVDFNYVTIGGELDLVAFANNTNCGPTFSGTSNTACEMGIDSAQSLFVTNGASISTPDQGLRVLAAAINGNILNEGYIGGNATGVQFQQGASLSGGITNSGSIVGQIGINVASGAWVTGGIFNTAGGYISSINNAGQIGGIGLTAASIDSGITNSGLVQGGNNGINIWSQSTLSGGINNSGHIIGAAAGVYVGTNSVLQGGIFNTGYISSISNAGLITGDTSAIQFGNGSGSIGSITNSGFISGLFRGIQGYGGSVTNGIVNSGTISGSYVGIGLGYSALSGGINNSGVIQATGTQTYQTGILLSGSQLSGGVTNSGQITGGNYGINLTQAYFGTGSIIDGGIINAVGGSIVGGIAGINVDANSVIQGSIDNQGYISSINNAGRITASGTAIRVVSGGVIASGITNSGLIQGQNYYGIAILGGSSLDGGINNSGTISGGNTHDGIVISSSTLNDGIYNTGSIGGGFNGLNVFYGVLNGGVFNAGNIRGGQTGIVVKNTGHLTGGITNSGFIGGGNYAIFVDPANSTLDNILITGNNTAAFGGLVYAPNTPVTVASTATYTLNSNFDVSNFDNQGILIVADTSTASPTITGTLSMGSNSSFKPVIGDAAHAQMYVTSDVNLAGSLMVKPQGLATANTFAGIITSGTTLNGTFAYTDTSVFYDLTPIYNATSLDLWVTQSGACGGFISADQSVTCRVGYDLPYLVNNGYTLSGAPIGVKVMAGNIVDTGLGNGVGINNSGVISGTQTGIKLIAGANLQGGISNSGSISGPVGIQIAQNATLVGSIVNQGGYISSINNSGLVASTHVALYLSQGVVDSGITNTGLITSTYTALYIAAGSTVNGGVVNYGTIHSTYNVGLRVDNAVLTGGVFNSGTIDGAFVGVALGSATLSGGLSNSGLIRGDVNAGIGISNGELSGGITNLAGGSIIGGFAGININTHSVLAGGITNAGYISSINNAGLVTASGTAIKVALGGLIGSGVINNGTIAGSAAGLKIDTNSTVLGGISNAGYISSINNAGLITASGTAIRVASGGQIASGITNTGSIMSNSAAIVINQGTVGGIQNLGAGFIDGRSNYAIHLSHGLVSGAVQNAGTLSYFGSGGAGLFVANGSTITGGIVNSGVVVNGRSGGYGIQVAGASLVDNGINNSGTINTGTSIHLNNARVSGGITNSGMMAASGIGIQVVNNSTVDRIFNQGGTISGASQIGILIDNQSSVTAGITNTGFISGLGAAINNQNSGNVIDVVNTTAGTQVGIIVGAINGYANVTNSGIWALQTAYNGTTYAGSPVSSTISGNFSQLAGGILQLGVNGSSGSGTLSGNYSTLSVGGNASLANGSTISVIMSADHSVLAGGTLVGVVNAGTLSVGSLMVSDNSALVGFNYVTVGGEIDLVAFSQNTSCGPTAAGGLVTGPCEVSFDNADTSNLYVSNATTITSTSQGVKVLAGVINGRIFNEGYIGGNLTGVQFMSGSSYSGGITNSGSIVGAVGINVANGALVSGGIVNTVGGYISSINNAGSISALTLLGASSVATGITNSGQIANNGNSIYVENATLLGGLNNSGQIGTASGNVGVMLAANATLAGGFDNTGSVYGYFGLLVGNNGKLLGGVTNSGLIAGGVTNYGIRVEGNGTVAGTLSGGLNNSGSISGRVAIGISQALLTGGLTNTGTISGGQWGLSVMAGSVSGLVTNAGLIQGVSLGGINIATGANLQDGLNNSGRISGPVGVYVDDATVNGGIFNSGLIGTASGNAGILLVEGALLSGGINNSGTITAYYGIEIHQAQLQGGLTNSGLIAGGPTNRGVAIDGNGTVGGTLSGGLQNSGQITGRTGVLVSLGNLVGGLTNSGQIVGQGGNGIFVVGGGSQINGNIVNTGIISSSSASGINVAMVTIVGNISNAGRIDNSGTVMGALVISNGLLQGAVQNASSGTIAGVVSAINLFAANISNGITNTGLITATGTAFLDGYASHISGGINNLGGTISGGQWAMNLLGTSIVGALNNTGLIQGVSLGGINIVAGANLQDGLTNSGTISGPVGINVGTNATINGLANIGSVSSLVNAGLINRITASGALLSVNNTSTGLIIGSINGNISISNIGMIALQTAYNGTTYAGSPVSASISGNYSQLAGGTLQIGVNGASGSGSGTIAGNYSTFNVGGSASLASGSTISVVMSAGNAVLTGQTLNDVLIASNGITTSGFTVSDNSALINFNYAINNGALDLLAVRNTSCGSTVSGSISGPCEVAFDSPDLFVASTGTITGSAQGIKALTGSINGRILNEGYIGGNLTGVQFLAGSSLTGGITNGGSIVGVVGVNVGIGANVAGGISNSGYISSIKVTQSGQIAGLKNSGSIGGISALGGTISNGLTNSGTISGYRAVSLGSNSLIAGGLNNTGRLQGDSAAVFIGLGSSLSGGLTSSGQIVGRTYNGIAIYGIVTGGIQNTGSIIGTSSSGLMSAYGGTIVGNINNAGLIISTGTSTSAIWLSDGLVQGSIVNQASGTISGGQWGMNLLGTSIAGALNNTGLIQGVSLGGINIVAGTNLQNGLTNSGSIIGGSGTINGVGVFVDGGSIGGISNSGYISSIVVTQSGQIAGLKNSGSIGGISVNVGTISNGLMNSGTISHVATAIDLNAAQITNGVTNAGLLQGNIYTGLRLAASSLSGGINNQAHATIMGALGGIVISQSSLSGGLQNAGFITSSTSAGLRIATSNIQGGVNNALGATISGGPSAINLYAAQISGGITNAGLITATGTAFLDGYASRISGGINNLGGTISGGQWGMDLLGTSIVGAFNNTGLIQGVSLGGINIVAGANLQDGLTNSGTISGPVGINVGTNATINGLANIGSVSSLVNAGLINRITASGALLSVNNTSTGLIIGSINGNISISNSGMIALQTTYNGSTYAGSPVSASISGNYSQLAGGTLQIGVNGASGSGSGTIAGNYSTFNVGGSASFEANSNVNVLLSSASSLQYGQTLSGIVIAANGLTSSGFTITDNSALLKFYASTTAGALSLVALRTSACGAIISGASGPCEVAFDAPNLTLTTLGSISGGSVGVTVLAGASAGHINNAGTIGGTSVGISFNQGASLQQGLTNSGLIQGQDYGVLFANVSALAGGFYNMAGGSIVGGNGGLRMANALLSDGFTNAGLIQGGWGAIFAGTAVTGGLHNLNIGTISGQQFGLKLSNSSISGGIANSGLITSSGLAGIQMQGAIITGGLSNSGTVLGAIFGTQVQGGQLDNLVNSGLIYATTMAGLSISNTSMSGAVVNATGGRIVGGPSAVSLWAAHINGGITNAGLITAAGSAFYDQNASRISGGINNLGGTISGGQWGMNLLGTSIVGAFNNTGLIQGVSLGGINIVAGVNLQDGLTNSGRIVGGVKVDHASVSGFFINTGTVVGAVQVTNTGYIGAFSNAGQMTALALSGSQVAQGITNSGVITSSGAMALALGNGATVIGGLSNSGTISATYGVSAYQNSYISGGLNNSGAIEGIWYGLEVANGSTLAGGITNTGIISESQILAGRSALLINNASVADGLNNLGGTITGVNGVLVGYGAVLTGGITNSGLISNINNLNATINGGIRNLGGVITNGITNSGLISNASGSAISATGTMLTVQNLASGTIVGAINGTATVTNAGMIVLQTAYNGSTYAGSPISASISGNYSQLAGGTLQIGVNGASGSGSGTIGGNYSTLNVGGSASLASGSTISVVLSANSAVQQNGTLVGIVSASGNLMAGSLNVVDNSALLGFVYETVGGSIDLVAYIAHTGSGTISGNVLGPVEVAFDLPNLLVLSTGTIYGGAQGVNVLPVVGRDVINGTIINQGLISGNQTGIQFVAGTTLTGGVTNIGTVRGLAGSGIRMVDAALSGGIVNTGQIAGGVNGLFIDPSVINGGITNTGLMQGSTNAGLVLSASTVNGGVKNLAGGTIAGGVYGLQVIAGSLINGDLTTAGVISGGTHAIYVDGTSTMNNIVIVGNNTAAFVGDVAAPNTAVSVANGSSYTLNSNFTVSGFNNAGTLVVPSVSVASPVIAGNFANTGTFSPTVNSNTDYSRLTVTGNVSLGGVLSVLAQNATVTAGSTLAGVISGATTLSGQFASVTDTSVLVNFTPVYGSTGLSLAVTPTSSNAIEQALVATGNQAGMGAAAVLDSITNNPGAMQPVFTQLNRMTTNQQVSNAVSQMLPQLSGASVWSTTSVLQSINQIIESRHNTNRGLASGDTFMGNNSVWMKPYGNWTNQANQNGAYGFKANTGGLILGADTTMREDLRIGSAFAWGNVSASSNAGSTAAQSQSSNMYQAVAYGTYDIHPSLHANLQIGGGWNNNNESRAVSFMGTTATASYNSGLFSAGASLTRPYAVSEALTLAPSVRLDYTYVRNQAYTETGAGALNLSVNSQGYSTTVLGTDAKAAYKVSDFGKVSANIGVGYNFSPTQTQVVAAFAGTPNQAFTVNGVNPGAVMGRAGVGYSYKMRENIDVGIRYDVNFQSGFTNQTATAKARWSF